MRNATRQSKKRKQVVLYPSKETQWAYWMQAIEPTSQEINDAFCGYHPQWVLQSQIEITADRFLGLRKDVLRLTKQQCAAYLRVSTKTISNWENGSVPVPFMAYELLRMIYRSVQFRLSHPDWDGWFISENGKLISPLDRDVAMTPGDLNLVPRLHNWNATIRKEIATLTRDINELRAENTALRQLFLSNGITDEVAAMQERINILLSRINTARIIPFSLDNAGQPEEKAA